MDPGKDQGQWYVVQTMSGQEFKIQRTLRRRRKQAGVEDRVLEILVPTEKVSEVRRGKKTTRDRKLFPGYILIRTKLFNEDGQPHHKTWYFIRETQGVIGFAGGDKPVPLSPEEVDDMLGAKEGADKPKPKIQFEVGETVVLKDGAFENFEGTVEDVDQGRGKLKVSVSIFGRSTPVEVEYWQVERS